MKQQSRLTLFALLISVTLLFWSGSANADTLILHPSGAASGDQTNQYVGGTAANALDTNDGSTSYGDLSSEDTARLALDNSANSGTITSVRIRAVLRSDVDCTLKFGRFRLECPDRVVDASGRPSRALQIPRVGGSPGLSAAVCDCTPVR